MKNTLIAALLSAGVLLGAADYKSAAASVRSAGAKKDFAAMEKNLAEALKLSTNDFQKRDVYVTAAQLTNNAKKYDLAAKYYGEIAKLEKLPKNDRAWALFDMGCIYQYRLKDKMKAIELFKKALPLAEKADMKYRINSQMGMLYWYGGAPLKPADGIMYIDAASDYPNSVTTFFAARYRIERKKFAEARVIIEKAKKLPKPTPLFLFDIYAIQGELLAAERKFDESAASYTKAGELCPRLKDKAEMYKFYVYRGAGKNDKAAECLKKIISLKSKQYGSWAAQELKKLGK